MKVANRKCIRNVSIKNMRMARLRNTIAVIAILLTTVLFTSVFTIYYSVINAYQLANFRQVGSYAHGELKRLTEEQFEEFKTDPHFAEYAKRVFIGFAEEQPFRKTTVEVSSIDETYAKFTFVNFSEGSLPAEHTNEAAADTRVLSLLGVTPKIGAEFTLPITVGGVETTQTFTLCGYWEFDEAMPACNVLLPFSKGEELFETLGIERGANDPTGTVALDFMLQSGSAHIEKDVQKIIADHGYQYERPEDPDYIDYGVNWGYVTAQANNLMDIATALALLLLLLLIMTTGYLIIYNVFRISVSNDIRYYGLLKTIGTTGRQIRRILTIQACLLSAVGIPLGLMLGYGIGAVLTPFVLKQFTGFKVDTLSLNPLIFAFSALFSLGTVILSCRKPGKAAAKISPVEAVRYTENSGRQKVRRSKKPANIPHMALANLCRTGGKTLITMLSLSLSVLLLNLTFTFARGFDMDKFLRRMPVDYLIADVNYFKVMPNRLAGERSTLANVSSDLAASGIVAESGAAYSPTLGVSTFLTEEYYRQCWLKYYDQDFIDGMIDHKIKKDGLIADDIQLYGMDPYCLDHLMVISGDITKLYGDGDYIAAVYHADDYDNVMPETNWAKVGDKVTLRYNDNSDYVWVNSVTGEVQEDYKYTTEEAPAHMAFSATEYHEKEYEVAATVMIPYALSYRYYRSDSFILGSKVFTRDTGTDNLLYIAFESRDGMEEQTKAFLADYTERVNPALNYESKETYAAQFQSFRDMFLLLGAVLSFIVGLVGILNFANAVLTGIFARHRELAVLQAIGMTGRQLKKMLIIEGLIYTLGAAVTSLALLTILSPLIKRALEGILWFFSYRFTVLPILLLLPVFAVLGALIPYIAYRFAIRRSIVERLREA